MAQTLITTWKSKIKYKECVYLLSSKSKSDSEKLIMSFMTKRKLKTKWLQQIINKIINDKVLRRKFLNYTLL